MERTIIAPEFKGGIWHRYFSTALKKDETLASILDEKMRYYKLYYPFLEKKQIIGKVYEELCIPHICGDLNRKELYKLFIKERKKQSKLKETYKKYPTLFIENRSRNKGTIMKPSIQTTKQIKVNNVHTKVEKSKEDHVFDNLLYNVYPKRKEGMIQNMNLKQTKSVRFNDGIEVHSVSPSQPLYKLKPLGRLFDEPSAVRSVNIPSYSHQLEEKIEDSDSDFDADTGITSDCEDYAEDCIEASPHVEDCSKNTEITENEKVKGNGLLNAKTKTIYDCYEDDSQSTDHEISKEGNDLILSSKMMTVVQGKWVRETKQIIGNIYHTKETIMSNKKSINEDIGDEGQELALVRSIEYILESIKSLYISNTEEHSTISDSISLIGKSECEPNMNDEKEHLMVGNIKVGQDRTDIEIRIQDKIESKEIKKIFSKNINSKISLEKDLSTHLIDEKLLNIDNNKLSYDRDIYEIKSNKEENIDKRIRTKPIKLVDDLIDYINDWNSSNEVSLNENASQASSTKSIRENDSRGDKYMKEKEITEEKSKVDDECSPELIEEERCLKNNSEELSLEEESCLDKEEDLSQEEKICLDEHNYSPLLPINNNQQVSSYMFESNSSLNVTRQSIKAELSSLPDKLRSEKVGRIGYETHDYLPNFNIPKMNEVSEEKEFQINDTFTCIRSMVCNQSTSNPNELYSTFCSLITKPILVQPPYVEEEIDDKDNCKKLQSFEAEELDEEKEKILSGYSVSEHKLNSGHSVDAKAKGDDEIHEGANMRPSEESTENNLKENTKIMIGSKPSKNSGITMISMDHSNPSLAGKQKDKENGDDTSKISISNKKLFFDEPENILDDIEKNEILHSETNSTNFLSKVQMWSSHSKNYSGNSTMASQASSVLGSCNTDSLQKKVSDMEDCIENAEHHNNKSYYSNSNEDSLTSISDEEDNIFDDLNNSGIDLDTGSSTRTVTPVKMEKNNSEEVSTAYETDPETGKLVMNHYLRPISNSTPIKLEQTDEQQDSVLKISSNENSLEELPTRSFHSLKENKRNQYHQCEISNKQSSSTSIIEESTIKSDSQSRNENPLSELSSQVSLLIANDKRNKTEKNEIISNSETQKETSNIEMKYNKNSKLNDLTESSNEKQSELLFETDNSEIQKGKKFSSESIIENSEADSNKTFEGKKNGDKVKTILSQPICAGKQKDQFAIKGHAAKTDINSTEISITSNIQSYNTFSISETPVSNTDQQNSNVAILGSSIQCNELYASAKKAELNLKVTEKSSPDTHSTDIIYDTSSIPEDYKFGKYIKTSTVGLVNEKKYNISEGENFINENELNTDELIISSNKKILSAVSESIINNDSKAEDNFTSGSSINVQNSNKIFKSYQMENVPQHSALTDKNSSPNSSTHNDLKNNGETTDLDLGIHETFPKNIKNRQANVSHVTFLIRDRLSQEDKSCITESGYHQLANLSQSDNAPNTKQYDQNKETKTNEILLPATEIQTAENTNGGNINETFKLPNSNLLTLDNNGSHFSLGVQNSHIEPTILSRNNDGDKYFTRSRTYLNLKRKLETINENDSGSDISLSHDELSTKEIKINVSGNNHSKVVQYSESPVTTDTSSIEMNLKRVNTDIRRKRAKLKKENPVRKSSTSSSEDEVVKSSLLRGVGISFESSKLPVHKFMESNAKIKQSTEFDLEGNFDKTDSVDTTIQQNAGRCYSNPKDYIHSTVSDLAISFENKVRNESFDHKVLNRQKETEYNQLSDSSSSIIYSSPNAKTGSVNKATKASDKSKVHLDNIKKRHMDEESQYFSDINRAKRRNEKSHKSFALHRKYDNSNRENSNICFKYSRPSNDEYRKKPLKQSNPGKCDPVLDPRKDQSNEAKHPLPGIKKNRKSSIVRLMGTAEGSQISNSPEVKGLLRRTYFMGNN